MLYITYRVGLSTILIWIYGKGTSIQQEPEFGTSKHYAVVTPLRKAASYEQRKTNLGSSP